MHVTTADGVLVNMDHEDIGRGAGLGDVGLDSAMVGMDILTAFCLQWIQSIKAKTRQTHRVKKSEVRRGAAGSNAFEFGTRSLT